MPALHPLRSQAEINAARSAGEWEAQSCGSSHRQHPWEPLSQRGKRQTQISYLPRAAMLLSDACSGWDKQANQEMQGGRTEHSQDLGHILTSSIKNSLPSSHTKAGHAVTRRGDRSVSKLDLEEKVDLIKGRPYGM